MSATAPRRLLALCLALTWAAIAVIVWREAVRTQRWQGRPVATRVGETPERCLACHTGVTGLAPAHDPAALGCASCHLGDPLAFDKGRAHAGMERFPGDLATARVSCGRPACHPEAMRHVAGSLMATGRGMIAVDRFCFGEQPRPEGKLTFADLRQEPHPSPANDHLRRLCASCHLGSRRDDHHLDHVSRGGGCAACHLAEASPYADRHHRRLTVQVDSDRCFGCHARSGRIALSYAGLAEVAAGTPFDLRLDDGRPVRRVAPDVHAAAGMGCVDCHTRGGLMGDGRTYSHKEEAVEIACVDCHPRGPRPLTALRPEEATTRRLLRLRGWEEAPVWRSRKGRPLYTLRPAAGGKVEVRSRGPKERTWLAAPTPADGDHTLRGHARLTCQACHAPAAPLCVGCHTTFSPAGSQRDHLVARARPGRWREEVGTIRFDPPPLAIGADNRVHPFVPAMELALQTRPGATWREGRYFAPLDPHTTRRQSRTCADCHRAPAAVGLGSGRVTYRGARWHVTPAAQPVIPPWVTPVGRVVGQATRSGARPFDREEIDRILTVGACLPCHRRATAPLYRDFPRALGRWRTGEIGGCLLAPVQVADSVLDHRNDKVNRSH